MVLAIVLKEIVFGIDRTPAGEDEVLFRFLFVTRQPSSKHPQNIMGIDTPMLEPPVHEIHPAVQVDARDVGATRLDEFAQLLLELRRQDFIGIQSQNPSPIEPNMIKGPIELQGLIHKGMLIDTTAMRFADFKRVIGAGGIDNDDIIGEFEQRSEASLDIPLLIKGENDDRDRLILCVHVSPVMVANARKQLSGRQMSGTNQRAARRAARWHETGGNTTHGSRSHAPR